MALVVMAHSLAARDRREEAAEGPIKQEAAKSLSTELEVVRLEAKEGMNMALAVMAHSLAARDRREAAADLEMKILEETLSSKIKSSCKM
ncbi:hypothetical protein [Synechococcus sp. MIT S1220]|uniref:hypothetical protein n=1 Tax=Synechococcus sp. MIT S1220 TaxID=3082549 RepID=UPI0039AEFB83